MQLQQQKHNPEQEQRRLEELHQYQVLDTDPKQGFDDLALLAASICETPIALVCLIDENRQWFKSRVGIDIDETIREIAFCSHAIEQDDLFIVEDASKDHRFFDNPLVTGDPFIRFYAGAPLISKRGYRLGTLCVLDRVPRQLSDAQLESLTMLANQTVAQLDLGRYQSELKILQGLVTICSGCKDIREEDGSWSKLDAYVQRHNCLNFTHGICSDCKGTLYPGLGNNRIGK